MQFSNGWSQFSRSAFHNQITLVVQQICGGGSGENAIRAFHFCVKLSSCKLLHSPLHTEQLATGSGLQTLAMPFNLFMVYDVFCLKVVRFPHRDHELWRIAAQAFLWVLRAPKCLATC